MQLIIDLVGNARCVYSESIPVHSLGIASIIRASHVEPTAGGQWTADLSPVAGPVLGPFQDRSTALQAETDWLRENWLIESS